MKKKDFVILCLRLLGIFITVQGFTLLPSIASMFMPFGGLNLFSPFVYLLCGIALLIYAPKLSKYIIELNDSDNNDLQISSSETTARIAFIILGIYIFTYAVPQLIHLSVDVVLYYIKINEIPENVREVQNKWTILIGPIIKLVLSFILIIGPGKVVDFISIYDDTFKKMKDK